jgi:uncharacterized repeat protein (TIGR01451 family)
MPYFPPIALKVSFVIAVLALSSNVGSSVDALLQAQVTQAAVGTSAPSSSAISPGNSPDAARQSAAYGKLPISFELNQGQTDGSVQFLARGAGYTLFLTPGEAVLALHARPTNANRDGDTALSHARQSPAAKLASSTPPSTVRLLLLGANAAALAMGVDPLPGKSNYLVGSDPKKWHIDVPTYAKVRYTGLYPGIDLLYYGNQEGRLEHDFVLAPGADPNSIAISLGDSGGAVSDEDGGLTLHTKNGDLTLRSPVAYQTIGGQRTTIPATYLLANNQIKFQLGSFDRRAPLVIDPVIQYSAVFGGSDEDAVSAIAIDSSGSAYFTGTSYSSDFPLVHPLQSSATPTSAFVSKINAAGTALLYSTYLGGTSSTGGGIAVDNAGRAYITGSTSAGLLLKNAYQPAFGGVSDAFVAVLNPAGDSLAYSTYLGGTGNDFALSLALDASQNAYITGYSYGGFPTLHNILPKATSGIFVAKFNSAGVLQYSSVFGNQSFPTAIAVDSSGSSYITGYHSAVNGASVPVTANAFKKTCATGTFCAFISKLSPTGSSFAYSTYLYANGASGGGGSGIAVDSSGNAYVVGATGPGFPAMKTGFQSTYGGGPFDGFVAKLNPSGSGLIWSTYLGGKDWDEITGIALDQYRQVYVTGYTCSSNFPLKSTLEPYAGTAATPCQLFVTTLSGSLGSIAYYSTYFGTATNGGFGYIAVDKALNVYLATYIGGFGPTQGAISTGTTSNPGGDLDVYISKLVIMDDLALGLSASSGSVVHGGNLTYTIAVTSKGPDFGSNIRIDDPLPAGTSFVGYNAGGGACTAPAVGGTGILHCTLPKLEKGATYTVTLTVKVNAGAGSNLSNTAATVSSTQDFVASNNKGTFNIKVN